MANWLTTLLSHISEPKLPVYKSDLSGVKETTGEYGSHAADYLTLLSAANGFYAYGRGLFVRPVSDLAQLHNIISWNQTSTWKHLYEMPVPKMFCFAESVFGEQFCFCEGVIARFDPESGEVEQFASSMKEWSSKINAEPDLHTGRRFLEKWESHNGVLPIGNVLVPKKPFILEGEYESRNLVAKDEMTAMYIRAPLANEIYDIPDGTTIRNEVYRVSNTNT